jgi:regulator of sigma E protease
MLLFMITVHEFGHYIVAKIFNFKVNEFAIGMGPAIYKKTKKNGEIFSIRALPLGGFCAFEGEDQENSDSRAFNNKKPWQRILVLIAGATMNFVTAILVFCISFAGYGQLCVQAFEALPSTNAYCLQNDDVILSLNDKDIYLATDLAAALKGKKAGDLVSATIIRNGEKINSQIQLQCDPVSDNLGDVDAIYRSLGLATISAVTQSTNLTNLDLNVGDYILRISSTLPTTVDNAANGYTQCLIEENGALVEKYILEEEYLTLARAYEPSDFANLLKQYSNGDSFYIFISRAAEIDGVQTAVRVALHYTLSDNWNETKQNDEAIFKAFGVTIERISYRITTTNVKFSFFENIKRAFVYALKTVGSTLSAFGQLITGKLGLNAIGGPVTTITLTAQTVSYGFNYTLEIMGFIGVSLAVFNLLPIPALDGARAVFVLIEWIRKKPINRDLEGRIHAIGLILLFVFAIGIDLVKCF